MPETQKTTIGRNWLLKTLLFLVLFAGFGVAGLVDALYFYPRRGEKDATLKLARHLQAAQAAGSLTTQKLKSADPRTELEALRQRKVEIERTAAVPGLEQKKAESDRTRMVWLESLALMWQLNAKPKLIDTETGPPTRKLYFEPADGDGVAIAADGTRTDLSPMDVLGKLASKLDTSSNIKPLSGLDMFFQWVFVVVGFGGGLYMSFIVLRVVSKKYSWNPDEQRLTLPGGTSFVPGDVKEFDKRLWHKFFVTVHLKNGAAKKLDLLRYVPLEEWVLAMEKTAFPEQAAANETAATDTEQNPPPSTPNN